MQCFNEGLCLVLFADLPVIEAVFGDECKGFVEAHHLRVCSRSGLLLRSHNEIDAIGWVVGYNLFLLGVLLRHISGEVRPVTGLEGCQ